MHFKSFPDGECNVTFQFSLLAQSKMPGGFQIANGMQKDYLHSFYLSKKRDYKTGFSSSVAPSVKANCYGEFIITSEDQFSFCIPGTNSLK